MDLAEPSPHPAAAPAAEAPVPAVAALIGALPWADTPLGPMDAWPGAMRAVVRMMLESPTPMATLWGPLGVLLYNDAYARIAGARHPAVLGRPVRDAWPEVAAFNQHVLDEALQGRTLSFRRQSMLLERDGRPEEAWFDLDYSPVRDDGGAVLGVLAVVVETTARVVAERELGMVFNQASVGICRCDLTGRFVMVNARFCEIVGRTLPEVLGRRFSDFTHPDDRDANVARHDHMARRGEPFDIEKRYVRRDGSIVWVHNHISFAVDAAGEPQFVVAVSQEITQRKAAEERERAAQEALAAEREAVRDANRRLVAESAFLRGLFEQAPSFMAVLRGPEHVFELANPPYLRLAGRDVVGRTLREALPEVEAQGFVALLDEVYASGRPYVGRHVRAALQREAGGPLEERVLDFVYQPIRSADGEVVGIFVEGTDITDRFLADERLQVAQKAGGIGTFEWFPETGRLVVSDEYRRIWGLASDVAVTDELLVRCVHEEDRGRTGPSRLHGGEQPLEYAEYRITRPDNGETRWIARRGEVVPGSPLVPQRFVGVAFDITERKRTETALRELNATLEQRIAEALAEQARTEEALRQAQKMEAVGQLTGGIAHDFNNLLQAITGSLDVIRLRLASGSTDAIATSVDTAMRAARRAAALTHRLLAFSRRQPLDPRAVDVRHLVGSIEELLRRTLGEAIALTLALAPDTWTARCDANQLENAVLNLVINARDAMPHGGRLTLRTSNVTLSHAEARRRGDLHAGDYVRIAVEDTGTGMAPDVLARAFDPFFTTKPLGQGTGLGLSMIYGFARQSGGHVAIDSAPGEGTVVELLLPRETGAAAADAPRTADDERAHAGRAHGVVLVVEDDEVVRRLVLDVVRDLGCHALEARDGPQALELLQSPQPVDLLVTDVGLPGLNGRQLAEAARAQKPDLPVLLMTGYAEMAANAPAFLGPRMALIAKPFALRELSARVGSMLKP